MKTGRNAPCPCGSGKKYKHCCQAKQTASSPVDIAWRRIRHEMDGLPPRMLQFTLQAYGPVAMQEAWQEFALLDGVDPGDEDEWDEDREFDPESPHMPVFMPWLLHQWSPESATTEVADTHLHGVVPTQAYLERHGRRLAPVAREYLQSCMERPFSFYEVEACAPGYGLTLRDLLSNEVRDVRERSASQTLQAHDVLYAQLACADGVTMLEATPLFASQPDDKVLIVELREQMWASVASADAGDDHFVNPNQSLGWGKDVRGLYLDLFERYVNPSPPVVLTAEGDPIELHTLVYDIDSAQAAFDALKCLDVCLDAAEIQDDEDTCRDADGVIREARINWTMLVDSAEPSGPFRRLGTITIAARRMTVEVSSRPRAERFKAIIAGKPAAHARLRADEVQSLDEAGDDASPPAMVQDDPLVLEQLVSHLRDHYAGWIDTELPALGGRTPRAVARTAAGREQVQALLQSAQRIDMGLSGAACESIFGPVRRQLGLPG